MIRVQAEDVEPCGPSCAEVLEMHMVAAPGDFLLCETHQVWWTACEYDRAVVLDQQATVPLTVQRLADGYAGQGSAG